MATLTKALSKAQRKKLDREEKRAQIAYTKQLSEADKLEFEMRNYRMLIDDLGRLDLGPIRNAVDDVEDAARQKLLDLALVYLELVDPL